MIGALRGMLRPSSALNVVFDGNSLVAGYGASGASQYFPAQTVALPPLVGSGLSTSNLGISGQTWRMMNGLDGGSSSDVDAAWAAGKYNVLVAWETTNAAVGGRTLSQVTQDCIDYIAARKAAHAWRVVLLTALPRYDPAEPVLQQWNALARANYRAWGADLLVDVRAPGSPFNFDGTVAASYQAVQSLFYETSSWVHLSDAGHAVVAAMTANATRRLPKRAP